MLVDVNTGKTENIARQHGEINGLSDDQGNVRLEWAFRRNKSIELLGTRLIKRLIALPGDTVAMRDNVLFLNGVKTNVHGLTTSREPLSAGTDTPAIRATEQLPGKPHAVQFLPEVGARRDFGPLVVPPDGYFFLGDNRDNSADSRYIGFVPRHLLVGRAHHILASADILAKWRPRIDRFGQPIQ